MNAICWKCARFADSARRARSAGSSSLFGSTWRSNRAMNALRAACVPATRSPLAQRAWAARRARWARWEDVRLLCSAVRRSCICMLRTLRVHCAHRQEVGFAQIPAQGARSCIKVRAECSFCSASRCAQVWTCLKMCCTLSCGGGRNVTNPHSSQTGSKGTHTWRRARRLIVGRWAPSYGRRAGGCRFARRRAAPASRKLGGVRSSADHRGLRAG